MSNLTYESIDDPSNRNMSTLTIILLYTNSIAGLLVAALAYKRPFQRTHDSCLQFSTTFLSLVNLVMLTSRISGSGHEGPERTSLNFNTTNEETTELEHESDAQLSFIYFLAAASFTYNAYIITSFARSNTDEDSTQYSTAPQA